MLRIKHLCFAYHEDHHIIKNLNMSVESGSLMLLTGKSGSGKTTFCEILSKKLTYREGHIFFDETEIKEIKDKNYFSKIHFIKQNPHHNFIGLNPERDFLLWNKKENLPLFIQSLEKYKLCGKNHELLWKMSFGEQKCVYFSYLEVIKRPLWVFDEPLEGVDSERRQVFIQTCKAHLLSGGTAIISSHRTDYFEQLNPQIVNFETQSNYHLNR